MAAYRPITMAPRRLLALVALLGLVSACGDAAAQRDPEAEPEAAAGQPPPLTLHRPDGDVDLDAWSYCYLTEAEDGSSSSGGCADGPPPEHPPELHVDDAATFAFPLDGWEFSADFRPAGDRAERCRREWSTPVRREGERYVIPAVVPAGAWDVDVFGRGGTGNDLSATFRWVTRGDGATKPVVTGTAFFLGPPSLGTPMTAPSPTVRLSGLVTEPAEASARFRLTASGGEELSFVLELAPGRCARDGVITFVTPTGPSEIDLAGAPPFTYTVDATLDGVTSTGTGSWPDDLVANGNDLELTFDPPIG